MYAENSGFQVHAEPAGHVDELEMLLNLFLKIALAQDLLSSSQENIPFRNHPVHILG